MEQKGIELWMGDVGKVRASVVRRQKTDRRGAEHLLQLLRENRFPQIWVPSLPVSPCSLEMKKLNRELRQWGKIYNLVSYYPTSLCS